MDKKQTENMFREFYLINNIKKTIIQSHSDRLNKLTDEELKKEIKLHVRNMYDELCQLQRDFKDKMFLLNIKYYLAELDESTTEIWPSDENSIRTIIK